MTLLMASRKPHSVTCKSLAASAHFRSFVKEPSRQSSLPPSFSAVVSYHSHQFDKMAEPPTGTTMDDLHTILSKMCDNQAALANTMGALVVGQQESIRLQKKFTRTQQEISRSVLELMELKRASGECTKTPWRRQD